MNTWQGDYIFSLLPPLFTEKDVCGIKFMSSTRYQMNTFILYVYKVGARRNIQHPSSTSFLTPAYGACYQDLWADFLSNYCLTGKFASLHCLVSTILSYV